MFTGIVEERGEVASLAAGRLVVSCRTVVRDSAVGSSIAVNGVCLTVVETMEDGLVFDLSEETFERSSMGRLSPGDPVNLERPVTLAARLGGHLVQGHVDGLGEVVAVQVADDGGTMLALRLPDSLLRYVVEKGSIAVDGVSLTVASVDDDTVRIALVPHTLAVTTLGDARPGDQLNVEVDVIAKYVQRLVDTAVEGREA